MIFKYGTYAHDQDEVLVRVSTEAVFDRFQRRMADRHEYTIIGMKKVTDQATPALTQASLTTALNSLIAAYADDYKDFGLYLNDGTTPTAHVIQNSDTFGGVKVVKSPSFLNPEWGGRTEYLNSRMYYLVLRAEIRYGAGLYDWDQRLVIRGTGAPKWRYSPQEFGPPQAQTLQTHTSFWYIQEGHAVGRDEYLAPPSPLFPGIEHGEMRVVAYDSPKEITVGNSGTQAEMYTTSWKYFMEAVVSQGFSAFVLPDVDALV